MSQLNQPKHLPIGWTEHTRWQVESFIFIAATQSFSPVMTDIKIFIFTLYGDKPVGARGIGTWKNGNLTIDDLKDFKFKNK